MYPNLKMQIFKCGIHQNYLAKKTGIGETVLSKIINGYRQPSTEQKTLLANYFEVEEAWLFENFDANAKSAAAPSQESRGAVEQHHDR